jgi:hypothetical protein
VPEVTKTHFEPSSLSTTPGFGGGCSYMPNADMSMMFGERFAFQNPKMRQQASKTVSSAQIRVKDS